MVGGGDGGICQMVCVVNVTGVVKAPVVFMIRK